MHSPAQLVDSGPPTNTNETVEIAIKNGTMAVTVKEGSLELGWLKPEGRGCQRSGLRSFRLGHPFSTLHVVLCLPHWKVSVTFLLPYSQLG